MKKGIAAAPARAPINPDFSRSVQQGMSQASPAGRKLLGFSPHPLKLEHLPRARAGARFKAQALPSRFDLRKQGRVSPVKDQGAAGTCWAFASLGSLESCLLPEERWDFSENNMADLLSKGCPQGYDREPDGGGNEFMATAYLARWDGPVGEEQDPYTPGGDPDCQQYPPLKHINRVLFLPDRKDASDNDIIKSAIMNYGSVFTTICYEDSAFQEINYAYYYSGSLPGNHAICLIGWDDSFDRRKFRTRPPRNGAYIAKNSWGSGWGDQGFFYISYYDTRVGRYNALFNRADPPGNYKCLYQYDPLGWVTSIGYASSEAWFANKFKADQDIEIGAASWYAASPASSYELYIYQQPDEQNPRSGKLILSVKGSIESASYFIRSFSETPGVAAGQSFSAALKINTPDFNYPVPVQMPVEGYSSGARSGPGQSFISADGEKWDDISAIWENSSVCLKILANA